MVITVDTGVVVILVCIFLHSSCSIKIYICGQHSEKARTSDISISTLLAKILLRKALEISHFSTHPEERTQPHNLQVKERRHVERRGSHCFLSVDFSVSCTSQRLIQNQRTSNIISSTAVCYMIVSTRIKDANSLEKIVSSKIQLMQNFPPTSAALIQHVNCCIYQASMTQVTQIRLPRSGTTINYDGGLVTPCLEFLVKPLDYSWLTHVFDDERSTGGACYWLYSNIRFQSDCVSILTANV